MEPMYTVHIIMCILFFDDMCILFFNESDDFDV